MTRVFSAVEIESDDVLDELERVRDVLNHDFNTVSRKKMHITLEFFSDLQDAEVEEVRKAMASVNKERFEADVKGIGCFPSWNYIRVVWAGISSPHLHQLQEDISNHDIKSRNRDFKPHITLFRVEDIDREVKQKLKRAMRDYDSHDFGKFEISKVKLYQSEMTPEGSNYHVIDSKELE